MLEKREFLKLGECATVHHDVLQKTVTPGEQASCAVYRPVGNWLNQDSSMENLVAVAFDLSSLLFRVLLFYRYSRYSRL